MALKNLINLKSSDCHYDVYLVLLAFSLVAKMFSARRAYVKFLLHFCHVEQSCTQQWTDIIAVGSSDYGMWFY